MVRSSPGHFSVAVAGKGHHGGNGLPAFRGAGSSPGLRAGRTVAFFVSRAAAVVLGGATEAGLQLLPHVLNGKQGGIRQEVCRLEAEL